MQTAAATLLIAARQLQHGGAMGPPDYGRIASQLREVTDQLASLEQRAAGYETHPVNFAEMLRATGVTTAPLPEEMMVEGPANDLRDLLCVLVEYAGTVGHGAIGLRPEVKCKNSGPRQMCVTELTVRSSDVPDFLQRKLWEAAHRRRGEVSLISELQSCRIEFRLPIERRRMA
jgi:hypothetical protein